MITDVHAHYYPQRYLELIGRPDLPPRAPAALGGQDMAERLGLLDQTGIDTQVLSVSQAQPYLPDAAAAAEAAKVANEEYVGLCDAHRGRFLTFAALPLPHVHQALAEIDRAAAIGPVVGFTIGCSVAGRQLDDPMFEPVFAELDRRGAVVFLHPVGHEETPWLAGHNLAWLVGAPFEDTAAALRLVLSGFPSRFPGLKFIVPHLGGTVPFLLARVSRKGADDIRSGLRAMYYDTVSGSAEALASASRIYGASQLLFGTDYPYCDEPQFRHHLSYLNEAGLDTDEQDQIAGGTAAALLRAADLPARWRARGCRRPSRLPGLVQEEFAGQVVRRLFKAGLSLASAQAIIGDGAAGDRVAAAIHDIRTMKFARGIPAGPLGSPNRAASGPVVPSRPASDADPAPTNQAVLLSIPAGLRGRANAS